MDDISVRYGVVLYQQSSHGIGGVDGADGGVRPIHGVGSHHHGVAHYNAIHGVAEVLCAATVVLRLMGLCRVAAVRPALAGVAAQSAQGSEHYKRSLVFSR